MEKISPKNIPCKNDRKSHLQKTMLARYVELMCELFLKLDEDVALVMVKKLNFFSESECIS